MSEKWVFTNWNAFITRSFSIQEMHNGFCIAAYDEGSKSWVQVSDVVMDINLLEIEMKSIQLALEQKNIVSLTYRHKEKGES